MARSLNKATLIGNLTRDPELRYTPQGTAVCSFSVATNRQWRTESGELKDEAEFHRVVAWDKLAEICSQMLSKGKRVFVEGRIQSRRWTGQDGVQRKDIEIVISDMILLEKSAKGEIPQAEGIGEEMDIPEDFDQEEKADVSEAKKTEKKVSKGKTNKKKASENDDIPF